MLYKHVGEKLIEEKQKVGLLYLNANLLGNIIVKDPHAMSLKETQLLLMIIDSMWHMGKRRGKGKLRYV